MTSFADRNGQMEKAAREFDRSHSYIVFYMPAIDRSLFLIAGEFEAAHKLDKVSFQWKNPDLLFKNPDYLLRNPDFLLKIG